MPVAGSFETYATKYVDPALGFAIGWNYWFSWAITLGVEVVAGGILMKYWFPNVPVLIWSALFLILLIGLNLLSVKAFGEAEFYFAGIKVVTVIIFLVVGVLMIFGILGGQSVGMSNYTSHGGPFPNGFLAIIQISFAVAFALQGTELLGIVAGESSDPDRTIPKANRSLIWRVIIFYIGAVFIVGALIPWTEAGVEISPFTLIFERSGIPFAGDIINFVIITSVLSVGNSGTYAASRVLYALCKERKGPQVFARVNKSGVPINALLMTGAIGCVAFLTGFYAESTVYMWLLALSGLAGLFTWLGIAYTHIRFRKLYLAEYGNLSKLKYIAPFYPIGSILAFIICAIVTIGTVIDPASRLSVYLGVPAFVLLWIGYKLKYRTKFITVASIKNSKGING